MILNTASEGSPASCAATEVLLVAVRRIRRIGSEERVMGKGNRAIASEDSKIESWIVEIFMELGDLVVVASYMYMYLLDTAVFLRMAAWP